MKFDIINRSSGDIKFTAEIECAEAEIDSVKIGLAVKWAVKSGANLRDADLRRANLYGANLCGADLRGADLHRANLYGANLRDADLYGADLHRADLSGANLRDADLYGADLYRANLRGANLRGADLHRADLSGANLYGANLCGADLRDQWIVQGPIRSDGYAFFLQRLTGEHQPMVRAGCRYFTLPEAREHWASTRGNTPLGDETFAILYFLEQAANIRGLIKPAESEAA